MSLLNVNAAYCDTTYTDGTPTHEFMVSVHDQQGSPVSGLTKDNFNICISNPFDTLTINSLWELPPHGGSKEHTGFYRMNITFVLPPSSPTWKGLYKISGTCGIEVHHLNDITKETDRGRTIVSSQIVLSEK